MDDKEFDWNILDKLPSIDKDRFRETIELFADDNKQVMIAFVNLFLSECQKDLQIITTSSSDAKSISEACHKMAGRCAQFGTLKLENMARQCKEASKVGEQFDSKQMEEEFEKVKDLVFTALN